MRDYGSMALNGEAVIRDVSCNCKRRYLHEDTQQQLGSLPHLYEQ
jgi:hypothetical protein